MGIRVRIVAAGLFALGLVDDVAAQPLGLFSWQLQPYCNVVTTAIVQTGAVFTLDGFDDNCGGGQPRSAVSGIATPNPDGSIAVGLTIVNAQGGAPAHVSGRITLPTASGTWSDSGGQSGAFVLGGRGAGSRRPAVAPPAGPPGPAGPAGPPGAQGAQGPQGLQGPQGVSALAKAAGRTCPVNTQLQGFTADGHALCAVAGTGAALSCPVFSTSGLQSWLTTNSRTTTNRQCTVGAFGYTLDVQTTAGEQIRLVAHFPGTGGGDTAMTQCSGACPGFPAQQQSGASAVTLAACRQQLFAFAAFAGTTCP